jgi:hypothetical protein
MGYSPSDRVAGELANAAENHEGGGRGTDATRGVADLSPWIAGRGGVFQPLQDPDYFARVAVDTEAGTLVWPNGVDLDPDMLYEAVHSSTP